MVSQHTSRAVFAGLTGAAALWSVPTLALASPVTSETTLVGASAAAGFAVGAACVAVVSHRSHRAQSEALEQRIRALESQVAAQAAGTQSLIIDPLSDYADASTTFVPSQGSASYAPAATSLEVAAAAEPSDSQVAEKPEPPELGPVAPKTPLTPLLVFPDKSGSMPVLPPEPEAAEPASEAEESYHSKHAKGAGESFSVEELLERWQQERQLSQEVPETSVASEPQAQASDSESATEVAESATEVAAPAMAASKVAEPASSTSELQMPEIPVPGTDQQSSEAQAVADQGFSAASKAGRRPELGSLPELDPSSTFGGTSASAQPSSGIHAAAEVDYERVASDYLDRKTFKNRMLALSKGVSRVLTERLGNDMMDDLPMIQRADGTVADLGTSWWEAAAQANDLEISRDLGPELDGIFNASTVLQTAQEAVSAVSATASFNKPFSFASERWGDPAEKPASSASAAASAASSQQAVSAAPASSTVQAAASATSAKSFDTDAFLAQVGYAPKAPSQAQVSAQEPTVFSELFPEHETAASLEKDEWQEALDALDVRFDDNLVSGARQAVEVKVRSDAPEPVKGDFFDLIGGADTLDEPDGLEPDTEFLTFRTPAGHPEVQDTNSYINYLVEHEIESNSSKAVRDHARRYFQEDTDSARKVV